MACRLREIVMAAMRFLDKEELEALTGYKQKKRQTVWLASNHIPFKVNALGVPVVLADRLADSLPTLRPRWGNLDPGWVEERQSLGFLGGSSQ